jgi:hypothetical protein
MIVDGHDLICADPVDAIEILQHHNLIKGDDIVIPAGTEVTNIQQFGGATCYEFNNGDVIVDLAFDDEDEYIGGEE